MKTRKFIKPSLLFTKIVYFKINKLLLFFLLLNFVNHLKAQTYECPSPPLGIYCINDYPGIEFKCIIGTDVNYNTAINNGDLLDKISAASTAQFIVISGKLTFSGNYVFAAGSKILMDKDAQINVINGSTLTFKNTHVFGCDEMWNGIFVGENSFINILQHCTIEDGKSAVNLANNSVCNANSSIFYNNYTSISASENFEISVNININDCMFKLINNGLKPPFSNSKPIALYAYGVKSLKLNPISKNLVSSEITGKYIEGIVANNTNLDVSNWEFNRANSGIICDGNSGSLGSPGNYSVKINGLGSTSNSTATFNENPYAIDLRNMKNVNIINCRIVDSENQGISYSGTFNKVLGKASIRIDNNRFEKMTLNAINIWNELNIDACIITNNFIKKSDNSHIKGFLPSLIWIEGSKGNVSGINISHNTIINNYTTQGGTMSDAAYGIHLTNVQGGKVEWNTVSTNDNTIDIKGIGIVSSNNINFNNNIINGPGITEGKTQIGISVLDSKDNYFGCNVTNTSNIGFSFENNCDGTETKQNDMNNHKIGLFLANKDTKIGEQDKRQNRWPITTSTSNVEAFFNDQGFPQFLSLSQFYVNALYLPSVYWPAPLTPNSGWFNQLPSSVINTYDCTISNDVPIPGKHLTLADNKILQHNYPTGFYADEFDQKLYLFEKLSKIDTLNQIYSAADTFYNENLTNIIGSIYELEQGIKNLYNLSFKDTSDIINLSKIKIQYILEIDSIFNIINDPNTDTIYIPGLFSEIRIKDSLISLINSDLNIIADNIQSELIHNAEDLYNIVSSYSSTDEWISDRLKIDEIILESIKNETLPIWTSTQKEDLLTIAEKCRPDGGFAITMARVLLDTTFNDNIICNLRSNQNVIQKLNQNILNGSIFPNPFVNEFEITIDNNLLIKELKMSDLLGKNIQFKYNLNEHTIKIIPFNLEPGIFFFKLTFENGKTQDIKLLKTK